jgi:LuxR family maltose regulon positive regulatory protein
LGAHGEDVRDVLLATSVADRLAPDLARHLSGSRDAGAALRALAHEGAFVEAVPGPDEAYRFTPLVRDLLTAEMRTEHPVRWRHLHRKAARWLAGRDQTVEALQQYAAAGDWGDVAGAFVQGLGVGRLLAGTSRGPLATTLATMPADVAGAGASVAAAAVAVLQGELEACDKHLAVAQELAPAEIAGRTVELDLAVALTALARSAAAGGAGGGPAVEVAERAYARAAAVRTLDAATAALVAYGRGCAQVADGDLGSARQTLSWAGAAARDARAPDLAARCLARLALADALLGRLADAVDAAGAAAACARYQDDAAHGLPAAADVALAWVDSERGNVADAATRIRTADTGAALRNDAVCAAAAALVHARVLRSRGDLPAALEALDRLRDLDVAVPEWLEHRLAGSAARLLVAQGQPGAAAERVQPSAGQRAWPSLLALGWAELPLGAPDESRQLARRVTEQLDAPLDLRVDAHLLVAATALALGQAAAAAAALDEAVRLASPEGIRRPFDEAPRRLRALVRPAGHQTPQARPGASGRTAAVPRARQPDGLVIQPLTERESEVLVHLDAHLRTEEIAAEMFVSVNTVKTHIRAILRKLSTERRTDAIRRARDLGLI